MKFILRQFFVLSVILMLPMPGPAVSQTNAVDLAMRIKNDANLVWEHWDNFDSHTWYKEDWGGVVTLTWGNFHGRDCLKVTVSSQWGVLRTDHVFPDENWNSPVTGLRMDVFAGTNTTGNSIKIETYNHALGLIQSFASASNLVYNQWKEIGWNFSGSYGQMAKLQFVLDGLGTAYKPYTFFVNNIRLVSNNVRVPWDTMSRQLSHTWKYTGGVGGGDAVNWNTNPGWLGALIPISHNRTSASNNAGALYMQWDAGLDAVNDYAKVEATINEDWSLYKTGKIRAMVNCSGTNMIYLGFWDNAGGNWLSSQEKRVTNVNTWEEMVWDIPAGTFNWNSLTSISVLVKTDKVSTGSIYFDNLMRGW